MYKKNVQVGLANQDDFRDALRLQAQMNEYMFDLLKRNGVTSGTDEAISTEFFDMKTIGIDSGVTNAT